MSRKNDDTTPGHETCSTTPSDPPGDDYTVTFAMQVPEPDPAKILAGLGARYSPDFDAYARGELDARKIRCVLCGKAPCECPPFGTPEYFALLDRVHGRNR
jgi:hypothetical protein